MGKLPGKIPKSGKLVLSTQERECYDEVEAEDEGRLSIAQDILRESTVCLRTFLAPNDGATSFTLSYVCPHCHCFPLEVHLVGLRWSGRNCAAGGVHVAASMIGGL